jgi:hypothetical protein
VTHTAYTQYQHQPAPPPRPGSGMAVAALVIALVSLLLCWVPIVNNLVFVSGLISLVLGIVAARRAKKGKASGRGMAVGSIIVSAVALVGVLATQALYVSILNDVGDEIDKASEEFEDELDGNSKKSAADKAAADAADVHVLGETAGVGDYDVAVTQMNLDAWNVISKENQFNEPAKGRYVMATISVAYNGTGEADAWLDLGATLAGSDNRNYDTSTCEAVVPSEASDQPSLTSGGQATFNVCFDVPKAALGDGASIYVEESFSLDEKREFWEIR